MLRAAPPLCLLCPLSVLCAVEGQGEWVTLRYYGRSERFALTPGWPDSSEEVCHDFPAVCVDVRLGECIEAPIEFRAPWSRNVTQRDAGRFIHQPPIESDGGGYLHLASVELKYETQAPRGHVPLQLFSGCSEGCRDCRAGTGLALIPVELPYMCFPTRDGGAFAALWNNGSFHTGFNCHKSLDDYWRDVEERHARLDTITWVVCLTIMCIIGSCAAGLYFSVRRQNLQLHQQRAGQIQSGHAHFTLDRGKVITQAQIEEHFPAIFVADSPQCVVCLSPVSEGEAARRLQCGHSFHAECVLKWWMYRPRMALECPVCKQVQEIPGVAPVRGAGPIEAETVGSTTSLELHSARV